MTPMSLERALEAACKVLENMSEINAAYEDIGGSPIEAAAALRAFLEKGLPFYRAAENYTVALADEENAAWNGMLSAYRAAKEASK